MRYLLDTCVLSELCKARPHPAVVEWLTAHDEQDFFLSVVTIGELAKGIAKLPVSEKRSELERWLRHDLQDRFQHRILPIDRQVADACGVLSAQAESIGTPFPVIDALLAATAIVHGLAVVTRNVKDFPTGTPPLVNPWA